MMLIARCVCDRTLISKLSNRMTEEALFRPFLNEDALARSSNDNKKKKSVVCIKKTPGEGDASPKELKHLRQRLPNCYERPAVTAATLAVEFPFTMRLLEMYKPAYTGPAVQLAVIPHNRMNWNMLK